MSEYVLNNLRLYVDGQIDFSTLEDRFIPIVWWDTDDPALNIVYQIIMEKAHVDDGFSDESRMKARLSKLLAPEPVTVSAGS